MVKLILAKANIDKIISAGARRTSYNPLEMRRVLTITGLDIDMREKRPGHERVC